MLIQFLVKWRKSSGSCFRGSLRWCFTSTTPGSGEDVPGTRKVSFVWKTSVYELKGNTGTYKGEINAISKPIKMLLIILLFSQPNNMLINALNNILPNVNVNCTAQILSLDRWNIFFNFQLAKKKKLFLMEAVWSRCFPTYKHLKQLLQDKAIGDVLYVNVQFGAKLTQMDRTWWVVSY